MPARPLKVEKLRNQSAKPTGSPFHSAKSHDTRAPLAEQRGVDHRLGCFHLVGELFVFGELAHELQRERGLAGTCGTDGEGHQL